MKNDIKSNLLNVLRILLLLVACLSVAFLIVWPLWKFSTSFSRIYTTVVLFLIAAFFIFLLVSKIRRTKFIIFCQFLTNFIFILTGLSISVIFILNFHRIFALISILLMIALEILINTLFSKKIHE